MRDIYDVFGAITVGAVLLWFIKSGRYDAFHQWVHLSFFS